MSSQGEMRPHLASSISSAAAGAVTRLLLELPHRNHVTNFYTERPSCCTSDKLGDENHNEKLRRLAAHLDRHWVAPLLIVGEAAGWRGARQTGLPFMAPFDVHGRGMKEASATTFRRVLREAGMADHALTWNAYPLHPHQAGNAASNRAPTETELGDGLRLLEMVSQNRRVITVGQRAAMAWRLMTGYPVPTVDCASPSESVVKIRHPSFGGVREFEAQMTQALRHYGLS